MYVLFIQGCVQFDCNLLQRRVKCASDWFNFLAGVVDVIVKLYDCSFGFIKARFHCLFSALYIHLFEDVACH